MDIWDSLKKERLVYQDVLDDCSYSVASYDVDRNIVTKEKTTMPKHALMNKMQKGMRIRSSLGDGTIVAFDYNHLVVGISFDHDPHRIVWRDPASITIISKNVADDLTNSLKTALNSVYGLPSAEKKPAKYPMPKKVIADVEAGVTVVLWDDGEKTIVRAAEDEAPDIYDAFCAAFCKRVYGSNSALKRELKKILVFNNEKKEE